MTIEKNISSTSGWHDPDEPSSAPSKKKGKSKKKKEPKLYTKPIQLSAPGQRVVHNWSQYQNDIFDNVVNGSGHTVVIARAGAAKTSTIVEALYRIPQPSSILVVAFNKSIRETMTAMAPAYASIFTLHSLGLRCIKSKLGNVTIDEYKCNKILSSILGNDNDREYIEQLKKCCSLAKSCMAGTVEELDEVIDKFGIDVERNDQLNARESFITIVQKALVLCQENPTTVDFDDMVWLPLVLKLGMMQYDRVFIDEAQDLNKAQRMLSLKSVKKTGRICAIGDDRQSIYAWRGADELAIQNIINDLSATQLPLSVSYRCAKSIVREAQKIVPDIEAAPNAIEGLVKEISKNEMAKMAKPGDFILSRINAPLIGLCLGFIRAGIPANVQGRDVGAGLTLMIKKSKAKSVDAFIDYVEAWRGIEMARLQKKRRDTTAVEDKAECLLALCGSATSLLEIKNNIDKLFADTDDHKKIILSSIHKSKGLERDRVFIIMNAFRFGDSIQEKNCEYVAKTRAKNELYLVR